MEWMLSKLVDRYEMGALTRRELISGLAMLAAAGSTAAAADGFSISSIHHVSVQVADMKRSGEFYEKVLGMRRLDWSDADTLRMLAGKCHVSIRLGKPVGVIDHFSFGLDSFDKAAITATLKARGAEPRNDGPGFHVVDPDGIQVQLMNNDADHKIGA